MKDKQNKTTGKINKIINSTDWVDDLFNEILNAGSIDELDRIKEKLRMPYSKEAFIREVGDVYQLDTLLPKTENWIAYKKVTDKVLEWIEKRYRN